MSEPIQIVFASSEMRAKLVSLHGDWERQAFIMMSWLERHGCQKSSELGHCPHDADDQEYIWTVTFPDEATRLLFKLTWF